MFGFIKKLFGAKPVETVEVAPYKVELPPVEVKTVVKEEVKAKPQAKPAAIKAEPKKQPAKGKKPNSGKPRGPKGPRKPKAPKA